MARVKDYPVRIVLPLSDGMAAALEEVRGERPRVEVIRDAIGREVKRLRRAAPKLPKP